MLRAGFISSSLSNINVSGDSTLALMLAAQERSWQIDYLEKTDLRVRQGSVFFNARQISVFDDPRRWFQTQPPRKTTLNDYDVILMRLDPPVDIDFLHVTHFLDLPAKNPPLIFNPPDSLRSLNEKVFALYFADIMAEHLITCDEAELVKFHTEHRGCVFKPLDGSIGQGVFVLKEDDLNLRSLIQNMTKDGSQPIMAQRYLPSVLEKGDRRVLIINNVPYPQMLVRIPRRGDFRSNLGAGGGYRVEEIGAQEHKICERVLPMIKERGLFLVGLDIIDGLLSEINITCPTGMRQLARDGKADPAALAVKEVEKRCANR